MSATPECVYRSDRTADFIVYKGKTFQKVITTKTLSNDEKKRGDEIGTIKSVWTPHNSVELSATKLAKGTVIFTSESEQVILAENANGQLLAYREVIEG